MIANTENILFIGGDIKHYNTFKAVGKEFKNTFIVGYENFLPDEEKIASADVIVLPTVPTKDGKTVFSPKSATNTEISAMIKSAKKCKLIVCGINNLPHCPIKIAAYANSEEFKYKNAVPTAEGALAVAIESTKRTICNSNVLIIGGGNISKALIPRLKALGAKLHVSARKQSDYVFIASHGAIPVNSYNLEDLGKYDIIFNTVANKLLLPERLSEIGNESVYIELASPPYGIDMQRDYNFKTVSASGLPAKYSLTTSVEITSETILKILRGELNAEN